MHAYAYGRMKEANNKALTNGQPSFNCLQTMHDKNFLKIVNNDLHFF